MRSKVKKKFSDYKILIAKQNCESLIDSPMAKYFTKVEPRWSKIFNIIIRELNTYSGFVYHRGKI